MLYNIFGDYMKNLFKHYVKSDNIIFKYASGPSEKTGKEFHTFNEIILFLKGDAELISENIHTKIKPNTIIYIPNETYHQVIIKGNSDNYCRCTISFSDSKDTEILSAKLSQIKLLEYDTDFKYLFEKLIKYSRNENLISKSILKSLLTVILCEISVRQNVNLNEDSQNQLILSVISHINQNLNKNISLSEIAKFANISISSLSHIFKKEMNIPIHKYIIKKRLVLAHQKIKSGIPATIASLECGFNDYSGFYKQYKNMFGHSPSHERKM